jgi:molybdopterin-binding protein
MQLSARNQLRGKVKSVRYGEVAAELVCECGGVEIVAEITRTSCERLGLGEGTPVTLVIKASSVMVATD